MMMFNQAVDQALKFAVKYGQWDQFQYTFIGQWYLYLRESGSLLVWGCGADSDFWRLVHQNGRTVFVETAPKWATMAKESGCGVIDWTPPTRRGIAWSGPLPPCPAAGEWNVIIIDGPAGHRRRSPGRELPIRWAADSNASVIVLHDYNRPWERFCTDKYLGEPSIKIQSDRIFKNGRLILAIWVREQGNQ